MYSKIVFYDALKQEITEKKILCGMETLRTPEPPLNVPLSSNMLTCKTKIEVMFNVLHFFSYVLEGIRSMSF